LSWRFRQRCIITPAAIAIAAIDSAFTYWLCQMISLLILLLMLLDIAHYTLQPCQIISADYTTLCIRHR
jgi:hypothetical protein